MNLLFAAAFFRNKRRKLEEQNKILKDKMIRCPKDKKDITSELCSRCEYSKKNGDYKKPGLCKYK